MSGPPANQRGPVPFTEHDRSKVLQGIERELNRIAPAIELIALREEWKHADAKIKPRLARACREARKIVAQNLRDALEQR